MPLSFLLGIPHRTNSTSYAMEPLSIATAVAGFADAAMLVGKGIRLLRTISNVDSDFRSLLSELDALQIFVDQVSRVIEEISQPSMKASEPSLEHLEAVLYRLVQTTKELESLAKDLVSGAEGHLGREGGTKISKVKWLKHRSATTALRQRCRSSREDMNSLLGPVGLLLQSARHAQLTLRVTEVQAAITQVINQAAKRAMKEAVTPAIQPRTTVAASAWGASESHSNSASFDAFAVDASAAKGCGYRCRCRCHITSRIQTPSWLCSIVGEYLLRYNAVPFFDKRPCDSASCLAGTKKFIRLHLHFPPWLLRSAIHVALLWHAFGSPGATMFFAVSRPISFGPIWAAIRFNNLSRLRQELSAGEILPTDIDSTTGEAILAPVLRECPDNPAVINIFIESWKHHLPRVVGRNGLSASGIAQTMLWKTPQLSAEVRRALERIVTLASNHSPPPSLIRDAILGIGPVGLGKALEIEPRNVNVLDCYGLSPLHWVAYRNDVASARLLLENKAKVELKDMPLGRTALHISCLLGLFDLAHMLLCHGADPNCEDSMQMNPLHYAMEFPDIVRLLLDFGALPNGSRRLERAPLHYLFGLRTGAKAGEAITTIAAAGGDTNLKSPLGVSTLDLAAAWGDINGVEAHFLCDARPDLSGLGLDHLSQCGCYSMNLQVIEALRGIAGRIQVDIDCLGSTSLAELLQGRMQSRWPIEVPERFPRFLNPQQRTFPPLTYMAVYNLNALIVEIREANWSAGLFLESRGRLLAGGSHQKLKRWLGKQLLRMQYEPSNVDRIWDDLDAVGYPLGLGNPVTDSNTSLPSSGEDTDPWDGEQWAQAGLNEGSIFGFDSLFGEDEIGSPGILIGTPDEPEGDEDEFFDAL
ncbi:hypothetical protein GGTG_13079 [Gaeumannomyces tritici R3-111a-1]|uniref:Uncharacterized protein n=1 Tax=Gaeumannomyces tritici (strain R3-111a-1) TaxID=644352 RepID=J3PHU8_GAET3|nr:hypothetical protein GGTG_13079 [Gaeumannomyces tritici R3-111a-1]EJT69460.1 hypothetical protein GGTG_13079 [Gaeumannomyces tritici R3-111a-1]